MCGVGVVFQADRSAERNYCYIRALWLHRCREACTYIMARIRGRESLARLHAAADDSTVMKPR